MRGNMKAFDLNGKWVFHEVGRGKWYTAVVPGSNYIDLLANNIIDHPYYDNNEELTQWVSERDWEYAREFTLPMDMLKKPVIMLEAERLDTIAEIYINDRLVARTENAFLTYKIDIKNFVSRLTNRIRIKFRSPITHIENMLENMPLPNSKFGMNGAQFVRKPAINFGWNNNLVLPFSGICGNIKIVAYDELYLGDLVIKHESISTSAVVIVKAPVKGKSSADGASYSLKLTITEPNGNHITCVSNKIDEQNELVATINKPELWTIYSKNSNPPLYDINVELIKDGEVIDSKTLVYGIKTIEFEEEGVDKFKKFGIVLNGEKIFIKGVTLMPLDSMSSLFNKKKMQSYLDSVINANVNLIRVFAGTGYMPDEFYSMCDERGILVWQDMPFVEMIYPFEYQDFALNVDKEIKFNITKLHSHPCCAVLCGNSGMEAKLARTFGKKSLKGSIFDVFYKKIPEKLKAIDADILYLPSSPMSNRFCNKVNNYKTGITHMWEVWGGMRSMQKVVNQTPRFCGEFGLPSMPSSTALDEFITKKQYAFTGLEMEKRQKFRDGNNKMLYYISSRFRVPRSMSDLIYYSQLTQAEYYTEMIEHLRRNMSKCRGVIMTSLNDCWAGIDYSAIDYLGNYKATMYKLKRAFAPVLMSITCKKGVVKVNLSCDEDINEECNLIWKVEDFDGIVISNGEQNVEISSNCNSTIASIDLKEIIKGKEREIVFIAELTDKAGKVLASEDFIFVQNKLALFPDPKLKVGVMVRKGIAKITIQAERFARYVAVIMEDNKIPFSNNYFDIMAGGKAEITIPVGKMKDTEVLEKLRIKSVANIDMKGNVIRDIAKNTGVLLSPKNIKDVVLKWFFK